MRIDPYEVATEWLGYQAPFDRNFRDFYIEYVWWMSNNGYQCLPRDTFKKRAELAGFKIIKGVVDGKECDIIRVKE